MRGASRQRTGERNELRNVRHVTARECVPGVARPGAYTLDCDCCSDPPTDQMWILIYTFIVVNRKKNC